MKFSRDSKSKIRRGGRSAMLEIDPGLNRQDAKDAKRKF
jgi:hypothetical protein